MIGLGKLALEREGKLGKENGGANHLIWSEWLCHRLRPRQQRASGVEEPIARFFEIPEKEQKKKMTNQKTYLLKRAVKGTPCPSGKPLVCHLLVSINFLESCELFFHNWVLWPCSQLVVVCAVSNGKAITSTQDGELTHFLQQACPSLF